ncbi:bacterioferritin [Paludibacterium paludis]|uniref:Bacterioferritin n=1 Tax=Paludibacterium paludis TaxID=1225769 RepID=A0A918P0F4_9NEIS|nr:bacterioferritin [Paludibacterium paludis]GGY09924.1 bacterioferritin [Paludibacterium paludis]
MQGNTRIIDILNDLLAGELAAIDQYLIHGEMYADFGLERLATKSLHESEHEREHARAIIQRILFLEGVPRMDARHPLNIGATPAAMLRSDLDVEYSVARHLKDAIAECEAARDYVTRDMLKVQLDDTEMDHAHFLEKQLSLIALVGESNYLQSQMTSTSA